MLQRARGARAEREAALDRQREFVADASHELRTPLTSVLANLELLADALDGERGEAAESALRSSQRMRRLVADLLLLARADAGRERRTAGRPRERRRRRGRRGWRASAGDHELERRRPSRAGRRRRARRAAPARAQPDRERDQPHARRARTIEARVARVDGTRR